MYPRTHLKKFEQKTEFNSNYTLDSVLVTSQNQFGLFGCECYFGQVLSIL